MKKLGLACLLAAMALIAACGRPNNQEPTVTITYANWNLGPGLDNALERQMLQAFMDTYPHIAVIVDEAVYPPWMDTLATAANAGSMPDVFMIDDIGPKVVNGWLKDITALALSDSDFINLPGIFQESVRINGAVYALPFAQHIHGYFVNMDLFETLGVEPPYFGISAEDFLAAVKAASDLNRPSIGLNQALSFVDWYPGAINPQLGFFAFDGLGFALNSPEMLEAVQVAAKLHSTGHTFEGLSSDAQRHFPLGYALGAFREGQMAFFYGGSWLMDRMLSQINFDWDFIGVPGGRAVATMEIVGISATSSHPEEAYLLARWMGHGTDGNLRRLELTRDMGIATESLPVTQNPYVLDALWLAMPVPGLMQVYAAMDRALIDGLRVMPGYMQARFSAPIGLEADGLNQAGTGVDHLIRNSIEGNMHFPNHSAAAEVVSRQQLEAALEGTR